MSNSQMVVLMYGVLAVQPSYHSSSKQYGGRGNVQRVGRMTDMARRIPSEVTSHRHVVSQKRM